MKGLEIFERTGQEMWPLREKPTEILTDGQMDLYLKQGNSTANSKCKPWFEAVWGTSIYILKKEVEINWWETIACKRSQKDQSRQEKTQKSTVESLAANDREAIDWYPPCAFHVGSRRDQQEAVVKASVSQMTCPSTWLLSLLLQ